MKNRKNQCHKDARNTKPYHRQTQTKCTQDGNKKKKKGGIKSKQNNRQQHQSKHHTHCKQMRIRKNQCHTDPRNTKPYHRQTQTKCTQDGNMTKKKGESRQSKIIDNNTKRNIAHTANK